MSEGRKDVERREGFQNILDIRLKIFLTMKCTKGKPSNLNKSKKQSMYINNKKEKKKKTTKLAAETRVRLHMFLKLGILLAGRAAAA